MNKKVITGIIAVLVVVIVGFGGYFLLSNKATTDAPTETKQPAEEIKVGNEDSKPNKDGKKSLVVYFSAPETDDPNKKMTTEEENSAIVVDGKVLGNTQYAAMLIEDIVVSEDSNIKVIFKYEDKYFEALDFIKKQKYDIILSI